ncbi:SctK family type III secretion system sorting platform protein, partial [Pseudomonas mosselii]|nr:SctK family type III secretion system sorting platform protein [Pseudomonas mosselii]
LSFTLGLGRGRLGRGGVPASDPPRDLDAYLPGCGLAFWLQACGEVDPGFARRMALRLPGMTAVPTWPMDAEQRDLARTLCLKVARDRSPECCHLLN